MVLMKDKQIPEYDLLRFKQNEQATLGRIINKFLEVCSTIEPAWKENFRNNPLTKENEASCIPEGRYLCRKYSSTKYQDVWEVTGIKGRNKILIHAGNYAYQSEGCILVGDKHTNNQGIPMVNNSQNTLNKLRKLLPPTFWLNIKCDGFKNSLCDLDPNLLTKEECQNVIAEKNSKRSAKRT